MTNHDRTYFREKTTKIDDHGTPAVLTVLYGTRKIGDHTSYISVTTEVVDLRGRELSSGSQPSLVLEHFPELAPLVLLHKVSVEGWPTHYYANAKHWLTALHHKHWQSLQGVAAHKYESLFGPWGWSTWRPHDPDPLACLKSTICLGALPEDRTFERVLLEDPAFLLWGVLEASLKRRLPMLQHHVQDVLDLFADDNSVLNA